VAASEIRFRSLVEATAQIVWRRPASGEFATPQTRWSAFTGQTFEELRGWGWLDAVHPDDRDDARRGWAAAVAAQSLYQGEHRLRRFDGEYRAVQTRAVPVADAAEGGVREWVGVGVDVTEQRAAEAALRASEARLRRVAESGMIGILFWDASGTVTDANDALLAMLGYTRDDVAAGRLAWHRLAPPGGEAVDAQAARELAATGVARPFETEYLRVDGTSVPVLVSAAVFEGTRERGVALVLDATERRALLDGERAARRDAEQANAAKAQFLATMSHELRTPLNAIGGYVQLMELGLRGAVTEAQLADLARIKRSGQHLLSLINDILNYARLEAGHVDWHVEDVPLADVLAEVEPMLAPQFDAKGVAYEPDWRGVDVTVRADREKVRQVLLNVLTNAVKFTDAGGRVSLSCAADRTSACVRVRDTGRGIPADQLGRVFDPFVQVDRHLTHASQQGVGLGLAISRDLARAMGGELSAESEVGAGSTFTLTLPVAGARAAEPPSGNGAAAARPPGRPLASR
jgi:PAS domain S-box-containing protein